MSNQNRNYKDSVFVDLFSKDLNAKKNFTLLYNALHQKPLPEDVVLQPLQIEQAVYRTYRNDVSFLIEDKLILLIEHQSTINENMPFRFLQYLVRLYELLINTEKIYSKGILPLPTPEFFVFYNGKEPCPTTKTLKLSDAFASPLEGDKICLEAEVTLININHKQKSPILEQCKPLGEYSLLVETVQKHLALDAKEGYTNAIKECINRGILGEYLKRKSKEVINMFLGEYDYETDVRVQREEAFASGLKEGIDKGMEQGAYQNALHTALAMKQENCEVAFIAKMTGLPIEEIKQL